VIIPVEAKVLVTLNYIDLGTGGLIAQVLIAGGVSGLVLYRKMVWKKIKRIFNWKRKKK